MTKPFEYLTTNKAAEILEVTRRRVNELCKQRRLGERRLGRDWLIDPDELADFILIAMPCEGGVRWNVEAWDASPERRKWRRKREETEDTNGR